MNKNLFMLGAIVLATASQANLISNGDFEGVNYTAADDYQAVAAGGSEVTGWTVGATSVDMVKGGYAHLDNYGIDLVGTPGPGSLTQTIALGGASDFDFSIMAASTGDSLNSVLNVTFGGSTQTINITSSTLSAYTLSFTGLSGTSSDLILSSDPTNNSNGNTFVDNASLVAAVPEPASMLALGLGAVALIKRRKK